MNTKMSKRLAKPYIKSDDRDLLIKFISNKDTGSLREVLLHSGNVGFNTNGDSKADLSHESLTKIKESLEKNAKVVCTEVVTHYQFPDGSIFALSDQSERGYPIAGTLSEFNDY